jgi:hypothetical protein
VDPLGDHHCTCTVHSGSKKEHDWVVDQITDRKTHTVKTRHVTKRRGRYCEDIELTSYLRTRRTGVFGGGSPHHPRPFRK